MTLREFFKVFEDYIHENSNVFYNNERIKRNLTEEDLDKEVTYVYVEDRYNFEITIEDGKKGKLDELLEEYSDWLFRINDEIEIHEKLAKEYERKDEWHKVELVKSELFHLNKEARILEKVIKDLESLKGEGNGNSI